MVNCNNIHIDSLSSSGETSCATEWGQAILFGNTSGTLGEKYAPWSFLGKRNKRTRKSSFRKKQTLPPTTLIIHWTENKGRKSENLPERKSHNKPRGLFIVLVIYMLRISLAFIRSTRGESTPRTWINTRTYPVSPEHLISEHTYLFLITSSPRKQQKSGIILPAG